MPSMKRYFPFFVACLCCFAAHAQTAKVQWAKGSAGNKVQQCIGVSTDESGNVYMAGNFNSSFFSFSNQNISNSSIYSNIFIVKSDSAGNLLWLKSSGGESSNVAAFAADSDGNTYIAGYYNGSVRFDGMISISSYPSSIFVAKLNAQGDPVWLQHLTDWEYGQTLNINCLAVDNHQNVYLGGGYSGGEFTIGSYTFYTLNDTENCFIAKLDVSGSIKWVQTSGYSPGANGAFTAMAVNNKDELYVAGSFRADSLEMNGTIITNPGSPNTRDFFVLKCDTSGHTIWGAAAAGSFTQPPSGISVDREGNAYITGSFNSDTAKFGNSYVYNSTPGADTNQDFYLVKYNSSGEVIWARGAGGNASDYGYSVATDGNKYVYVSGGFTSHEFSYGSTNLLPPAFFHDPMFVMQLDTNGEEMCATTLSCGGSAPNAVCVDQSGNVYAGGNFRFNSFIAGKDTLSLSGEQDVFIAKLTCRDPLSIEPIPAAFALKLYPNPFNTEAIVEYSLPEGSKNAVLVICDILGRQQRSYPMNSKVGEMSISSANLSPGVYLYSLVADGKVLVTNRMVMQY